MNTEIVLDTNKKWMMVAYTDGGCRPNPGSIGSGVHAFIAEDVEDTKMKPLKITKDDITRYFLPTTQGYQYCSKDGVLSTSYQKKGMVVKPSYVVELAESFSNVYTNNYAEANAALNALRLARRYNVDSVHIIADSEYVLKAISVFRSKWEANGFMTQQGLPVKNQEVLKAVFKEYDACVHMGVIVTLAWIKGHSDHPGNHDADQLATIGVIKSQQGMDDSGIKTYTHKEYWEPKRDRHPLMSLKRMYFNRHAERNRPGVYYMGDPGKDDALIGKPLPETVYAVVKLKEPDPIVESVLKAQGRYEQEFNVTMMMKMESVFQPDAFRMISAHKEHCMLKDLKSSGVVLPDGRPMTIERNPIGITMRAVDALNALESILDSYEVNTGISDLGDPAKHLEFTINDVTEHFYDIVTKGDTTKKVFKKDIVVGQKVLDVTLKFGDIERKLPLRLGLDIMDRNGLKQLETSDPVLHVITWRESSVSLRYASVLLCDEGHAIWSNFYADRIMLPKAE
jgi:ribonuclease HI